MTASYKRVLKVSCIASKIISGVKAPQIYGEKLIKPSSIAYVEELLDKKSVAILKGIPLSIMTITRRQNELYEYVEKVLVDILKKLNFI